MMLSLWRTGGRDANANANAKMTLFLCRMGWHGADAEAKMMLSFW